MYKVLILDISNTSNTKRKASRRNTTRMLLQHPFIPRLLSLSRIHNRKDFLLQQRNTFRRPLRAGQIFSSRVTALSLPSINRQRMHRQRPPSRPLLTVAQAITLEIQMTKLPLLRRHSTFLPPFKTSTCSSQLVAALSLTINRHQMHLPPPPSPPRRTIVKAQGLVNQPHSTSPRPLKTCQISRSSSSSRRHLRTISQRMRRR